MSKAIRGPVRPLSSDIAGEELGKFPFDAFEWEESTSNMLLRLRTPWILEGYVLDETLEDYPEQGSNDDGSYIRFPNGFQICMRSVTGLGPVATADGSGFVTASSYGPYDYPKAFTTLLSSSVYAQGGSLRCWVVNAVADSTTQWGQFRLGRFTTNAATTYGVRLTAFGMWK